VSDERRDTLDATVSAGPHPETAATTPLIDALRERMGAHVLAAHAWRGDETVSVGRDDLLRVMALLRDDPAFRMNVLMDLTVVDYLGERPRFEVVYHLFSIEKLHRLRVKVRVPEAAPHVPSLVSLWESADWMEREAWDLYGVVFDDHPDLRRILLYPEFEGFPLRKDYPKEGEQPLVELKDHRPWPRPKPPDVR